MYTINEISKILRLPKSTIRFWDKKNIINSIRRQDNRYRIFSRYDLIRLCDIIFFRNSLIPIKKLYNFEELSLEDIKNMLKESSNKIEKEIEKYNKAKANIKKRSELINEVEKLSNIEYCEEKFIGDKIIPFDYVEVEKTQIYINNPYNYVDVIEYEEKKERRGLCVDKDFESEVILYKNSGRRFLTFLLKEYIYRNYQSVTRFIMKSYNILIF